MPKILKINKGDVFGKLVIVKEAARISRKRKFLCECTCEERVKKVVALNHLTTGKIVSCGCYHREIMTTHGLSDSRLYFVYKCMIGRCYRKNTKAYPNYGGRGIKVCKEWCIKKDDLGLKNFIAWNSSLPKNKQWNSELELDRKDNNGNYTPSNCRWVKSKTNLNNKRSTVTVTYKSKQYCFSDFYSKYGNTSLVVYKTALARVKSGWDCLEAVTFATKIRKNNVLRY